MSRKTLLILVALSVGAVVTLSGIGSVRYGGPANLWRSVRSAVAARQPHPDLVPTPLPITAAVPGPDSTASQTPVTHAPTTTPVTPRPMLAETAAATRAAISSAAPVSPTPSATASQTPAPTATPSRTALPSAVRLTGLTHAWQTWNNCGPATLGMALSYFGRGPSQADIAAVLRPNADDKNVNPEELAGYARTQGLRALARSNGNTETLRQLLAAGVPVLIETWHEPKPNDGMGHYRLLTGYDDEAGQWIAYDSYDATGIVKGEPYAGIRLPYAGLDALWAVFNRQYIVIYDEARTAAVERILGADLDDAEMWHRALAGAQTAVAQRPDDPFAWFNLGSDLVAAGRFEEAAAAYDRARQIGLPWRMLWYQFGPFRAYFETGRYAEVIALADATIRTAQHVEELFFWRGLAQGAQGDIAAARGSWTRALALNPNYADAQAALTALP